MSEVSNNFRSSPFGGFNRDDVIDYITKSSSAHENEKKELGEKIAALENDAAALQSKLDEANAANEELEAKNQSLEKSAAERICALEKLERDMRDLRDKLDGESREYEALNNSVSELKRSLEQMTAKCDALNTVISEQNNRINDYEQSKLRVADIELAAYERAEEIERKAMDKAEHIIHETERFYQAARDKYGVVHINAAAKIMSVAADLRTVADKMSEVPGAFDAIELEIDNLRLYSENEAPEKRETDSPQDSGSNT
ncbi:MAG: hypothetical protein LBL09_02035 [Oscillospiraceae bacterium]|jgi:chromosome segregation ATPase|nr:hypothetical protein [Oscillospiraceae bacterium]